MKFGFRKPRAIAPAVQLPKSNPDSHGHAQNCLNCGAALVGAYCHQCGQSAHTHRMSFKHFLLHDFVHGVWHLDKGFPATLKKAFVNPGKEIRAYLAGKRVGWFSLLTLLLLLFAAIGFLEARFPTLSSEPDKDSNEIIRFVSDHGKWFLMTFCFVCSWSSVIVFRRTRFNLTEHTILNLFFFVGILGIYLLDVVLSVWVEDTGIISPIFMAIYLTYAYYGAFRHLYSFRGWLWRYLLHWLLCTLFTGLLLAIALSTYVKIIGVEEFKLKFGTKKPPQNAFITRPPSPLSPPLHRPARFVYKGFS